MGYDPSYQEPVISRDRKFPLLMFSSGFTMPAWAYLYVGTRLASHGFIVAIIQHFSELVWPWDGYDGIASIAYNRPRDISFTLSELLKRNGVPGDLLYGAIDDRHLVSSGHSYGGYAALVEVGGDDQVCDSREIVDSGEVLPPEACQANPPDPRFSTLITLDASAYALRFGELTRIKVPSLIMGEESFERFGGPFLSFVARPHAAISRDKPAIRVDVVNTDHFSFSNECDGVRWLFRQGAISKEDMDNYYEPIFCQAVLPFAEGHRIVTKYMIAFLKTLVLHERGQAQILTPGYAITREKNVELYWTERCDVPGHIKSSQFTYRTNMAGGCAVGDKNPEAFFYP
jgi:predicted dienelactone hydrolase